MASAPALVFGAPGGVELFVILLVSLLLFSPLLALVYLVLFRERVTDADERVAELESEVSELRARLDEREAGGADGTATGGTGDPEEAGDDSQAGSDGDGGRAGDR